MKKNYFLLFLFILSANLAIAQNKQSNVTGIVLDEQNKPIDYATVGLFKTSDSALVKTALTTPDGKFQFISINEGSYFIKINVMGYAVYKGKSFDLSADLALNNINLQTNSKTLQGVSVTAVKPLIERKVDKLVMNVEGSSVMTGSTALEVLQKAPGVTVDQNDKISMQGKQGVLIMLDGKQTYMSMADVANMLRNMQSSEIETIELITNPSSKYDASGNSGIINIKTKKSKNGGTNGSVNANGRYGKTVRGNAGINLNHRTKNLNIFGNYNYGINGGKSFIGIDRISNAVNATPSQPALPATYFTQEGNTIRKYQNNNFKIGMDVFLDKKNTIGVLVNGYLNNGDEKNDNITLIGPSFTQADSILNSISTPKNRYNNLSYNLNYKSVLDTAGSEISADLDYSKYNGKDAADYSNDVYNYVKNTRSLDLTRNTTPSEIDIKAFKVDY